MDNLNEALCDLFKAVTRLTDNLNSMSTGIEEAEEEEALFEDLSKSSNKAPLEPEITTDNSGLPKPLVTSEPPITNEPVEPEPENPTANSGLPKPFVTYGAPATNEPVEPEPEILVKEEPGKGHPVPDFRSQVLRMVRDNLPLTGVPQKILSDYGVDGLSKIPDNQQSLFLQDLKAVYDVAPPNSALSEKDVPVPTEIKEAIANANQGIWPF